MKAVGKARYNGRKLLVLRTLHNLKETETEIGFRVGSTTSRDISFITGLSQSNVLHALNGEKGRWGLVNTGHVRRSGGGTRYKPYHFRITKRGEAYLEKLEALYKAKRPLKPAKPSWAYHAKPKTKAANTESMRLFS